jgi:Flp pilus assembly protein TadG
VTNTSHPVRRRWHQGEPRGSAAVEFALVLPLVLTMALVLLQLALVAKDRLILQDAARAGAREAAVTTDDAAVRDAAVEAAASLQSELLTVSVARQGGVGTPATVTVGYHVTIDIPIVAWLLPSGVDMSVDATMRQEGG